MPFSLVAFRSLPCKSVVHQANVKLRHDQAKSVFRYMSRTHDVCMMSYRSLTIDPAVIWTSKVVCCTAPCGHSGSMVTADIVKGTQLASLIPAHVS